MMSASCHFADWDFSNLIRGCQSSRCSLNENERKTQHNNKMAQCKCDDECGTYADCCYDSNRFDMIDTSFQCVKHGITGVYMKTECPLHLRETHFGRACESDSLEDPYRSLHVTSEKTNFTYKNIYCALCHNESQFKFWTAKFYYLEDEIPLPITDELVENRLSYNSTLNSWGILENNIFNRIYISHEMPTGFKPRIRECTTELISTCKPEWNDAQIRERCAKYTYVVTSGEKTYRNPDCAKCNNEQFQNLSCINLKERGATDFVISLNVILSFEATEECREDEFYNRTQMKCMSRDELINNLKRQLTLEAETSSNLGFVSNRKHNSVDYSFNSGECNLTDDYSVLICSKKKDIHSQYGYKMVSLVGYSLSIGFLLIHLILFIFDYSTTNLSKNSRASLSLSILFAYLIFLLGGYLKENSCYPIGVILSYTLLASFVWMLTISYDTWWVIKLTNDRLQISSGKQWKRFVIYSLWSWLMPAIIVGAAVYTDFSPNVPRDWKPQFGGPNCWFGQSKALLVFFVSPFTIIMILNFIFFAMSANLIYRIRRSIHTAAKKDFLIFLKLALAMGLTWTVGLIAMVAETPFLWYIFIILNSFQGVYIFISFNPKIKICNINIFKQISSRYKTSTESTALGLNTTVAN